jgi:hypothetical protein
MSGQRARVPWKYESNSSRHAISTNIYQQGIPVHPQTHQPSPARVNFFDEQIKPRNKSYNGPSESIFAPSAPRHESRGFRPLNNHRSTYRAAASTNMVQFDETMNVPVFSSPVISFKAPAMPPVLSSRPSIESAAEHGAYTLEAGYEDERSASGILSIFI